MLHPPPPTPITAIFAAFCDKVFDGFVLLYGCDQKDYYPL